MGGAALLGSVQESGAGGVFEYSFTGTDSSNVNDYTESSTKYRSILFGGSGTFTVVNNPDAINVDVYLGAGGAGGGPGAYAGGGGGGGARQIAIPGATALQVWTITVGAGGTGCPDSSPRTHTDGVNSTFVGASYGTLISCTGGGRGGAVNGSIDGNDGGGGGGGAAYSSTNGDGNAGGYSPVEGYNGNNGVYGVGFYYDTGGGGGGSGAVGQMSPGIGANGGPGGASLATTYHNGTSTAWSGGGGGGGGYNQNYPRGSTGANQGYGYGGTAGAGGGYGSSSGSGGICILRFAYEW
jgi:hypothetical protein